MKYRKSKFDNSVIVIYLEEGDERYNDLKNQFEEHGYAFINGNTIIVDYTTLKRLGYGSKEHLIFIESHEISHKILNHKSVKQETETEADYLGILICLEHNLRKSAEIGIKNFKSRNNISFKKYDLINRDKFIHFAKKLK